MCRSIKRLVIKDQKISDEEIYLAARQFVRKITGIQKPSDKNKEIFEKGVTLISKITKQITDEILVINSKQNKKVN